jgi:hypothetical protein
VARGAIAFIEAMNFQRVDLLGVSIGSFVAQDSASCARKQRSSDGARQSRT